MGKLFIYNHGSAPGAHMRFPTNCLKLALILVGCITLHADLPATIKNLSDRPWRLVSFGSTHGEIKITCMDLTGIQIVRKFPGAFEKSEDPFLTKKVNINLINIADFYAIDVTIIPNTFVTLTADKCDKDFSRALHLIDMNNNENRVNYGSLLLTVRREIYDQLVNNGKPSFITEIRPIGADTGAVLKPTSPRTIEILKPTWGLIPTRPFRRWRERYKGGAPWEAEAVREGIDPGRGIQMWRGARKAILGDAYMESNGQEGYREPVKVAK
jgi:hypothetical protein